MNRNVLIDIMHIDSTNQYALYIAIICIYLYIIVTQIALPYNFTNVNAFVWGGGGGDGGMFNIQKKGVKK